MLCIFNVVSAEESHKAHEKPDEYKNLVVGIAGFFTYSVSLYKSTPDDFIRRTKQAI